MPYARFYLHALLLCAAGVLPMSAQSTEAGGARTARDFYTAISGDWEGPYSLWMRPGTPARESEIRASIRPVAKGHYFEMYYAWQTDGQPQEGVFLFGGHGKSATATWGDSWHMVPEPMQCEGQLSDSGDKLVVIGSYSAGEGPDWGWRTEFTLQGSDTLLMEAYNITPDGREGLAVRAQLSRAAEET